MRKSKTETAESRRRIIEAATDVFRKNGIHATGLADVMAAAGMTVGGFYRHFRSKDHLVAEACAAGLRRAFATIDAMASNQSDRPEMTPLFDSYFSADPQANPLTDCPFVSLGSELARADGRTRALASKGLLDLVERIADRSDAAEPEQAWSSAMFAVCAIVGTLTMARLVTDPALAQLILQNSKRWLAGVSQA